MRVLVDSDVLVAVMDGTEAQSPDSKAVLDALVRGEFVAMTTPLIAANVMYALRRKWRTSRPKSWQLDINDVMTGMLATFRMLPVDERDFLAALPVRSRTRKTAYSISRPCAAARLMA